MRILLAFLCLLTLVNISAHAQLLMPIQAGNGGSPKASISERVGITDIVITYSRPAVRGREGKIWGDVIHKGFKVFQYGYGNPSPWRAGANENTTIEFSTAVMIENKLLLAGKYGFFIAYGADECILIFSKNANSWGNYYYNENEDALRVKVKPTSQTENQERLIYEFSAEDDSSATIALKWEHIKISFRVSTELQKLQLASFENDIRAMKVNNPNDRLNIAWYLFEHNIDLPKALQQVDKAASSMPNFNLLTIQAEINEKLGYAKVADSIYKRACLTGSCAELYYYGLDLMERDRNESALNIFETNLEKYPNEHLANIGISKYYLKTGDSKRALKYANKALTLTSDEERKKTYLNIIEEIKNSK